MITVVFSVYNTGRFLPKAMDSMIAQTTDDFEIIIVDDGSNDGSEKICDEQAERRPGTRVIHKPNGGLSSGRNTGIDNARGEYIIFPDPDDWVEPDYLEKLLDLEKETGADLAVCGHYDHINGGIRTWNAGASPEVLEKEAALEKLMLPSSYCGYAWNKLYHMDVIRENGLRFDEEAGMLQDLLFAVEYFMHCDRVTYDPVPLYHYNHDSGGVTASYSPLTPRKLTYALTYRKIIELTQETRPKIAEMAGATLCHLSLQYIYIYYRTGMKDQKVLDFLVGKCREFMDDYRASEAYTERDKLFCGIALSSPRTYYLLTHLKKVVVNNILTPASKGR